MPPESMDGIRRLATRRAAETAAWSGDRTIVVAGSRREAGASTVAALLALASSSDGRRTLLIDANDRAAAQHKLLGVDSRRSLIELQHPSVQAEQLLTPIATNAWLLPCVAAPDAIARFGTTERRSAFRRVAQLYNEFDVILIDAGSQLDSIVAAAGRGAWRFLTVSNADSLSLASTYAAIKAIDTRWRSAPVEVLINRMDEARGRAAYDQVRAGCRHFLDRDVGFSGTIPLDLTLSTPAGDSPALLSLDHSIAARVARQFAVRLIAELDDSALA